MYKQGTCCTPAAVESALRPKGDEFANLTVRKCSTMCIQRRLFASSLLLASAYLLMFKFSQINFRVGMFREGGLRLPVREVRSCKFAAAAAEGSLLGRAELGSHCGVLLRAPWQSICVRCLIPSTQAAGADYSSLRNIKKVTAHCGEPRKAQTVVKLPL